MQSPTWVRARELDAWAKSPQAKVLLPELIGRLVKATVPQSDLIKCNFASEAETHRPGYDGTTVTKRGTLFVPEGIAYWELGCDASPEKKAQRDYLTRIEEHESRVKSGEADDISQAVFVAVTARDWHGKKGPSPKQKVKGNKKGAVKGAKLVGGMETWAKTRAAEKRFKAVEAYDSNILEQWLRDAPAVALWLAKEMGRYIAGVMSLQSYWLDIQAALERPLPPEALLVSRTSIAEEFKRWLAGDPQELPVRAPSAIEVVAVFAAWVHTLHPKTEGDSIFARSIVVEDREAWRALGTSQNSLILIAAPELNADRELFSNASRQKHFVLRHADQRTGSRGGAVELGRMRRFDLEEVLKKAGMEDAEARHVAHAAGGNFTILRRIYGKSKDMRSPQWANDSTLAALLLAGAWIDEGLADRKIIEKLTKLDYANAREIASNWRSELDAPLRLIEKDRGSGKVWEFLSPLDAWEALRYRLNPDRIAIFEEVAVQVLSEDDPGLGLSPDERPMASIKGLTPRFSHDLRQGIAEILAIGSTREDESGISKDLGFAQRAASIVQRVLCTGCGWQRWASLGELLSSLVEAAPDEFLSAVENDLLSPSPQTVELMRQEIPPTGFGGAAYHSGLLWALETAAWPRAHLDRVAAILAQLAERDPGGVWSNRPGASATSLFFSWRPQTVAPLRERIEVLRTICDRWPKAAWGIVVGLMPDTHGSSLSDSSKPVYRDWFAGWTGEVSNKDYFEFIDVLAELAFKLATLDPGRLSDLLSKVTGFYLESKKAYENVYKAFESVAADELPADTRVKLWQELRWFVQQHIRFHRQKWALPTDEVSRWASARDLLAPGDPVVELAHLFTNGGWIDDDESLTYEQVRARQAEERHAAIRKIWSTAGAEGMKRLLAQGGEPWLAGSALAEEAAEEAFGEIIPGLLACEDETLKHFAGAFAAQLIHSRGVEWAESVTRAGWSIDQIAAWSIQMPFGSRAWDWTAQHGEEVSQHYWQRTGSLRGRDLSMEDAVRAFESFLRAGRPWDGLQLLVSRKDIKQPSNSGLLCTALEAVRDDTSKSEIGEMDAHNLREALSFLQKPEAQADETRLVALESSFLSIMDGHFLLPRTLQRQLASNPGLFVECLKILYRAPREEVGADLDDVDGDEQLTESQKKRALRIWKLLRNWHVIPGTNGDGVIDVAALREWVIEARKQAQAAQRLAVCDSYIGGLFAQSPPDKDSGMPLMAIRDLIEECASEKMETGFVIGLHNLRGGFSKSLDEGGKQERKLAADFEKHARICSRWTRTARSLREVSKDYLREADREDERVEGRA